MVYVLSSFSATDDGVTPLDARVAVLVDWHASISKKPISLRSEQR
jgi:hypothetical protein